jgi:hypothetical protein
MAFSIHVLDPTDMFQSTRQRHAIQRDRGVYLVDYDYNDHNQSKPSKRAIRSLHAQARLRNISDAVASRQLHASSELVVKRLQH